MEDLADMFDNGMQAQFLDDNKPKNTKKIIHVSINPLSKKLEAEVSVHSKIITVTDFDKCMEDLTKASPMFNDNISTKLSTRIADFVKDVL
jgi:hypothetical protein